ncbi:nucleolar protein [Colletotrichum truncatum]|uniref:Nucleolar protein n=1 Tax=Colletotrichum truncatum TaxID=5467 RepID=A0ACC3ZIY3_COLTU|nr:nucleolar protein [Colletotrichum truncatum]KAF6791881.1 nucleolar protein [Colletotrichum truncatum]
MFELPDAKRVRREDLNSSSEDEAPQRDDQQDAELLAKLHARMAGMLDLSSVEQQLPTTTTTKKVKKALPKPAASKGDDDDESQPEEKDDAEKGNDEPEEFEFRLFSTAPVTKIALVDEDELALEKEGAMARKKPLSYYIAEEATPAAKEGFAFAAVTGEDVLERAKQRWWGMETPWRVTEIKTTPKKGTETKDGENEETARRRRPGKKKRIALRMKEREKKKKAEEAVKAKTNKEEHLKEKKKRLNRLKKLRRRAKDKEAKQGGADADDDDSGSGSEKGEE